MQIPALPRHVPPKLLTSLTICFMLAISDGAAAQVHKNLLAPVPPSGKVLQVGTYQGKAGGYSTIQAAVDAAQPGDWILIAPGTYHEKGSVEAGVLITKHGLHVRGMDRNGVVIDGTNPGYGTCSSDPAAQDVGPGGSGRNGIEVVKVDGVSVENLTVCNYLGDLNGNNGNQIWWNGGDGSGKIGMGSFSGAYLTANSTFYQFGTPNLAEYGIFVSNAGGPGSITYSYASNMSDSAFYVGACANCNTLLRYVHAQNSAQGYSGSNAGGNLVLEDSEWDHNQAGIVPSSLANDDPPSPQDGACAKIHGNSCTIIQRNWIHDNNNPNTPAAGLAATVPVGTGIDLTGGRNNTVQHNLVTNNGSWGILLNDYPEYSASAVPTYCQGGIQLFTPAPPYDQLYAPQLPIPCYFHSFGNLIMGNVFNGNGFFGNETNGDLANAALPYATNNCFKLNVNLKTVKPTSSPLNLQAASVAGTCNQPWNPDTTQEAALTEELGCASVGLCSGLPFSLSPLPSYPLQTQVKLFPIPVEKGMANPCLSVPANSWCTK